MGIRFNHGPVFIVLLSGLSAAGAVGCMLDETGAVQPHAFGGTGGTGPLDASASDVDSQAGSSGAAGHDAGLDTGASDGISPDAAHDAIDESDVSITDAPTDALTEGSPPSPCMSQVSTGLEFTCGVKTDGTLWCWGSRDYDKTGLHQPTDQTSPKQPTTPAGPVEKITTAAHHACALVASDAGDKQVWCWGLQDHGRLGDGKQTWGPATQAVRVEGLGTCSPEDLSAGYDYTCVRCASGAVKCWGYNPYGQVGAGDYQNQYEANEVALPPASVVTTGGYHACAVAGATDQLYCWGKASAGQLGVKGLGSSPSPVEVPQMKHVQLVAAGGFHTCAVRSEGAGLQTLWCWGSNSHGQLGLGPGETGKSFFAPRQITFDTSVEGAIVSLSAGDATTCLLTSNATVWCAGNNSSGQLSLASNDVTELTMLTKIQDVRLIAPRDTHTCALIGSDRKLWCWGANNRGQLGLGYQSPHEPPSVVPGICDDTSSSDLP